MYKLIKGFQNNISLLKTNDDESIMSIPFDPANTDYQAYLAWLKLGNTPIPAETTV